jgi:hypothetical protein
MEEANSVMLCIAIDAVSVLGNHLGVEIECVSDADGSIFDPFPQLLLFFE